MATQQDNQQEQWDYCLDGCDEEGKIVVISEESGYGAFPVVHRCKLNHRHGIRREDR